MSKPSPLFPFFNLLLAPLVPALGLYTLHRRYVQKKSPASFRAQWGYVTPPMRRFGRAKGPKIWLHAVSVGETMAAKPIARALKEEIPGVQIALSSTTDTGHELAQGLLKNGEVDCIFYFPLDLAPVQWRVLTALRPDAICFVETELWPNLLHLARQKSMSTFLVNGRVSDNLLKTAPKLGPLWKWMCGNMSRYLMRGEADAERLRSLGVPSASITVTGDVKLEAPPVSSESLRKLWRERLGLNDQPLLIAGSTHAGEEEMLLRSYAEGQKLFPSLRLAIAPRHINRADEVALLAEQAGFSVVRRSSEKPLAANSIYLLDTVGELSDFYSCGDLAFVGGSLIPRGGHNVLEPILRGAPVVFGPYMMNFRAAAELVEKNELGTPLQDAAGLLPALTFWLQDENRAGFQQRVEEALAPHQGAAKRLAQQVAAAIR
jgi:3-deoxy-D-manno-octulosonic-acid transferase